jgi:hypothetical protein
VNIATNERIRWRAYLYSGRWITVELQSGSLNPGDTIMVTYGDRSQGGPGSQAPRVPVPIAEFTVSFDVQGYCIYRKITNSPRLSVTEGDLAGFNVVVPSLAVANTKTTAGITAVDSLQNRVQTCSAEVIAMSTSRLEGWAQQLQSGLGVADITLGDPGVERIEVRDQPGTAHGLSNPIKVVPEKLEFGLYWGDIHGHSSLSDGRFPPNEYFAYARNVSRLDFCALTDHDNVGSNSNVEEHSNFLSPEEWEEIKRTANVFNEPGRFTTLIAYEYTNIEIEVGGHRNVYFESDDPPMFPSWSRDTNTPTKLYDALRSLRERVLVIPHHPLKFMGWEHAPEFQRLFEVYSMWGSSEKPEDDCAFSHPVKYHHGGFSFRDALARGYRFGLTAGGDNHDSLPGIRQATDIWRKGRMAKKPGLVAVYAAENSRRAIFDALWNRRCYATTGSRSLLGFRLNGTWMGTELTLDNPETERNLEIEVIGETPVVQVSVIKNGTEVLSRKVHEWDVRLTWTDTEPVSCTDYYYVTAQEEDGSRMWSSPIWVQAR